MATRLPPLERLLSLDNMIIIFEKYDQFYKRLYGDKTLIRLIKTDYYPITKDFEALKCTQVKYRTLTFSFLINSASHIRRPEKFA